MNEQDWNLLSAYCDGELGEEERARVEARLTTDESFRTALAELEAVNATLAHAFDEITHEPLPTRLKQRLEQPQSTEQGKVVNFPKSKLPVPLAMAASLVIAVTAGLVYFNLQQPELAFAELTVPQNTFDRVMQTTPSDVREVLDPQFAAQLTPVTSFQTHAGIYCREFSLQAEQGNFSGVACKQNGHWQPVSTVHHDDDFYRPASGAHSENEVSRFIESNQAGTTFDKVVEQQLILKGWHR